MKNLNNVCPMGFRHGVYGSDMCEVCKYSACNDGLCGAECQDCGNEVFANESQKAYICKCSKVLFEDRK